MNRTLQSAALAAALLCSFSANADDGISRLATGVGRAIASQGNAALVTIRDEIKDTLANTLEPFLPADDAAPEHASDAQTTPSV